MLEQAADKPKDVATLWASERIVAVAVVGEVATVVDVECQVSDAITVQTTLASGIFDMLYHL